MQRTRGSEERVVKAWIREVAMESVKALREEGLWREIMIMGVGVDEVGG